MKKIAIVLLCATLLSGCVSVTVGSKPDKNYNSDIVPNVVEYGKGNKSKVDNVYFYVVDKNTGVVYLASAGCDQRAITVMLNVDGTPITAEQLGLPY